MKFRYSLLAVTAAILTAATAGSALAAKTIAFTGTYSGNASTKIDGTAVAINATGTGKATLIGAGQVTGIGNGDTSQQPCVPFGGTGKLTGAAGTVTFKLNTGSSGCGDEGGHIFGLKGYAVITKATGKLAKAKGTLKFTGTFNHDDGSFTVKFSGSLKA